MLTVQSLKGLYALIILKLLNPRGRHRGSGRGPIGSSFPRHCTRISTKTKKQKEQKQNKKNKKIPRADCKLAQEKKYRTKTI